MQNIKDLIKKQPWMDTLPDLTINNLKDLKAGYSLSYSALRGSFTTMSLVYKHNRYSVILIAEDS